MSANGDLENIGEFSKIRLGGGSGIETLLLQRWLKYN